MRTLTVGDWQMFGVGALVVGGAYLLWKLGRRIDSATASGTRDGLGELLGLPTDQRVGELGEQLDQWERDQLGAIYSQTGGALTAPPSVYEGPLDFGYRGE